MQVIGELAKGLSAVDRARLRTALLHQRERSERDAELLDEVFEEAAGDDRQMCR